METLALKRTVTVRPDYIKAEGTDKSRFAEEDALEQGTVECLGDDTLISQLLFGVDPVLLAEVIEHLEKNK